MLDVRYGGSGRACYVTKKMYSLINDANGTGVVWAVLNPAYTRLAMQQTGAADSAISRSGKTGDADAEFDSGHSSQRRDRWKVSKPFADRWDDANTLAQLMTLAFAYQQYQAKQQNPDLADLLGRARK